MIKENILPVDLPVAPGTASLLQKDRLSSLKEAYLNCIHLGGECDPRLAEVISYVQHTDGSFLRAQLGYGVMRAVGADESAATTFGIAVELFHTASLVIDDLPCMDDATHRRGRVCPHLQFTEADAHLASLAFIHHGYDLIFSLLDGAPAATSRAARQHLTRCLGVQGILSGQCADLHFEESDRKGESVTAIARGKTGTMLNLILGFPAILHQADREMVDTLIKLGEHWGVSYQILDDFKDLQTNASETGKTSNRDVDLDRPNYVTSCGQSSAWYRLNGELMAARNSIEGLKEKHPGWNTLQPLQDRLTHSAEKLMDHVSL